MLNISPELETRKSAMKKWRFDNNWSQEKIAEHFGLTQSNYSAIESGRTRNVDFEFAKSYKELTGIDLLSLATAQPPALAEGDFEKLQAEMRHLREKMELLEKHNTTLTETNSYLKELLRTR
jgi:transcriptional regulator with XRE-family HTH domain